MEITKTLIDARAEKRISQSDLAAAIGITQPALSLLESGHNNRPHKTTRIRLEKVLNCKLKF